MSTHHKTGQTTAQNQAIYRSAESVSPKHPDKLCDQISDAILDAHLQEDPYARVAIDVAGAHGTIFIAGEISSRATSVRIDDIVHRIAGLPENGQPFRIITSIQQQSTEIAQGVDSGGAGDQGIMVGYATDETPEYLPLEYVLARNLNKFLFQQWPHDGKTQVTTKNDRVVAVVASFQHAPTTSLHKQVKQWLEAEPLARFTSISSVELFINPAGDWHSGGFDADSGLTGRKLAVDGYGPRVPLGGGAYSGKDGTKVDRSAAYMARKIAVDYLKQRQAHEVCVYLAYAIGYPEPIDATVVIDGQQERIEGYNLTPEAIISTLNLRVPQFEQRAQYGHF